MVIPSLCERGINRSHVDSSIALDCDGRDRGHGYGSDGVEFRGTQSSVVSCLGTVKNTEVHNGHEAWRALNAAYDSNNIGRQRVWMQLLVTAKTPGTDCSDDRSNREMECDVRE